MRIFAGGLIAGKMDQMSCILAGFKFRATRAPKSDYGLIPSRECYLHALRI